MAAATAPQVINSAQVSPPGVFEGVSEKAVKIETRPGREPVPPSDVQAKFLLPSELPNPRPPRVLFAALGDPQLKVLQPIPLDVSVEGSSVVVGWASVDEFGVGDALGAAMDDFASALRELFHRLHEGRSLGPDLEKVRRTLDQYIQARTR